ncbi:MAG: hypothetical protein JXQ27_10705 [Acidobacteria bacterium]|nr:hypothetical protein [Acidobacteriota bacterium]
MVQKIGWLMVIGILGVTAWADVPVLEKTERALQARRAAMVNYSVEVVTTIDSDTPRGRMKIETRELYYFGPADQVRKQTLSRLRNGLPVAEGSRGGPGRGGPGMGRRGMGLPPEWQGRDLALAPGILKDATVSRPAGDDRDSTVIIEIRPELGDLEIDKGALWVDPATGMPLKVQLNVMTGPFGGDAELTVDYVWDRDREITVPAVQTVRISGGGFDDRGGFQLDLTTRWLNFQWDLEYEADFFTREDAPPAAQPRPRDRTAPADEDPFEEIRITPPRQAAGTSPDVTGGEDPFQEVLIEGGSSRGSGERGMDEGTVVQSVLGFGGRSGPGGGMRGARIAGSRANRIQGSAQLGLTGSFLDARPYSLSGQESPAQDYLTWNAGISVGGPIGGGGADELGGWGRFAGRPFFFVEYTTTRGDELFSQYASVPTLLERRGDFSATTYRTGPLAGQNVRIYDPQTGELFANALIPTDRIDPIARQLLNYFPLPNQTDAYLNYFGQESMGSRRDRLNVRIMAPLGDSLRVMGGYNYSGDRADVFNIFPDLTGERSGRGQNASLSLNQGMRRGFMNNFRLQWNRNRSRTLNPFAYSHDISGDLGIQNTSANPIDYGLPMLSFTNYQSLNDGNSSLRINESWSVGDSLQWLSGRHFFRLGAEVTWRRINNHFNPNGAGRMTFAGVASSGYLDGQPLPGTGYDAADFLLGLVQSSNIQYGNTDHYLRRPEVAVYLNDNWRLHSRFTLQWGFRYEYVAPWVEKYDRMANIDLGPDFSGAETVLPGGQGTFFGTYPQGLVRSDWNNFAPRVGLAYRLMSGRYPAVLRASYGAFFPNESYGYFANQLIAQPPFGYTVEYTAAGQDCRGIQTAFTEETAADVPNTYAVDPDFRLPVVQTWNLSWQQGLPWRMFVSLGYAGSRGTGLELLRAPNRLVDGQPVLPGTAQFLYLTSAAASDFHGMQLLVTRRIRAGFSINGQYEFGKSLDNASSIGSSPRLVAQNDDDLDAERGRSAFDRRHKLAVNWFWELPFGSRQRWLREEGRLSAALRNWFLTGTLSVQSGLPFTPTLLGNQINNSGTSSMGSERASVTGEPVDLDASRRTTSEWFNTGAFTLPGPGTYGDATRGAINGPGQWTLDLTLTRSILLNSEGRRLLISLVARNIFNHANFTAINTTVNSIGFGQVTAVAPMRSISLNLRFMY